MTKEADLLQVLQTLRMKGRATTDDLTAAVGLTAAALELLIGALVQQGFCEEAKGRFRLSAAGRAELERLLAAERATIDQGEIKAIYHEFDSHNAIFKQLVTDWQLKDGLTPNDHSDTDYDAAIVERLAAVDSGFVPLLTRIVGIAPRLGGYPRRFSAALEKVVRGDHSWLARPMIDSYHTVWFELHEELIGLIGLSRVDEALEGRAQ